jgi:prepilin peptidase CpaA
MLIGLIVTIIFAVPLLAASCTDFWSMKIPNVISLAMAAGFFLALPLTWPGLPVLGEHLMVGFIFFVAGFLFFAAGWIGGGDAKLMAAIALWFGWADVVPLILYTTAFGAALGIFMMVGNVMLPLKLRTSVLGMRMFQGKTDMPYGLALSAGALFVWPTSQLATSLMA